MEHIKYGNDGLIPGIVQNAQTGKVLMLGYLRHFAANWPNPVVTPVLKQKGGCRGAGQHPHRVNRLPATLALVIGPGR